MPEGELPQDAMLLYHRRGALLRYKTESMTNHELRELCVGLWARLSAEDRHEHIMELVVYHKDPASFLSPIASSIARAGKDGAGLSLKDVTRMVWEELPP